MHYITLTLNSQKTLHVSPSRSVVRILEKIDSFNCPISQGPWGQHRVHLGPVSARWTSWWPHESGPHCINTLRPKQNGHHFPDDIFKCIFLNENIWISIKISLNFVLMDPISNIPAVVQIMAWRRPVDKPLSEPMVARLPTHICVSLPQWVKGDKWPCYQVLHHNLLVQARSVTAICVPCHLRNSNIESIGHSLW